jgi:hypothetical protein
VLPPFGEGYPEWLGGRFLADAPGSASAAVMLAGKKVNSGRMYICMVISV